MRPIRNRLLLLLAAATLLLGACGKDKQAESGSATPADAVTTSAALLRKGDFDALWKHLLPPAEYARLREGWNDRHNDLDKVTDEDRRKFAQGMALLTSPDAENGLWQKLEPQLAEFDKKYKAQLPLMIGMGQTVLGTQIDNAKDMSPAQKQQARDLMAAIGQWAQQTPWSDRDKAHKAIGVVTGTARKLDIKTLDQAYRLDYATAMKKYGVAWDGLKQLLAIYGLSIDQALDSVKAEVEQNDGHTARVKVTYTLLDKPMSTEVDMVRLDGRWYDRNLLEKWRKARARAAAASSAAAPVAPQPASSAAPASSTTVAGAR